MISSLEELYEFLNIEKRTICEWTCPSTTVCNTDCEYFDSDKSYYPPITKEKQLNLIKWLSNFRIFEVVKQEDRKWFMCVSIGSAYYESRNDDFIEALIDLVFQVCKILNDSDRQELKGILQ